MVFTCVCFDSRVRSYPSLPQKNRDGVDDRSEPLKARFKRALKGINAWYGHQKTHVLLVTTDLPTGYDYTNAQPYEGRGWVRSEALNTFDGPAHGSK